MKMRRIILLMLAFVLAGTAALAQEYVSIEELYDQAQAMGGWWKETFDTPNGEVTIDAPIIVPDIEEIPVITVEAAKMSETVYNQIQQGNKTKRRELVFEYEVELNGKEYEFFFGNVKPEEQGYETIQTVWIQHGGYRFNDGTAPWVKRVR